MAQPQGTAQRGSAKESVYAELELRRRKREKQNLIAPEDWRTWCNTLFPKYFSRPFADHHVEFWEWIDSIQPETRPRAFIGIWGRGDAKSTSAEAACVRLGSKTVGNRKVRKYGLYVSSTQDKADGHVMTIGSMLESKPYANYYGKMSSRAVNKYGDARGWKHNRLITADGFAIDAFGLDSGIRGARIDEARPDFIVIDDVDEKFDSLATVTRKMQVITDTVLPSGSDDCAILFIQNLIHPDSIASQLADGRADFLRYRILSGPHPAVRNLVYHWDSIEGRYIVDSGIPTWSARTLEDAQRKIDDWGLSAYLREAQHEVQRREGPWKDVQFMPILYENLPIFEDIAVWVDPAISSTDNSDCQGIACGGRTVEQKLIGLQWWEGIDSPLNIIIKAIRWGIEWGASHVGVETDQGGDTWKSVYFEACDVLRKEAEEKWLAENPEQPLPEGLFIPPKFTSDKVTAVKKRANLSVGSKLERNSRMQTDYEKGKVQHMVGTHTFIENALYRIPHKPWDLADAWWWVWFDMIGHKKDKVGAR